MTRPVFRPLVLRGEAGVSCDDAGLALSGEPLVIACRDAGGFVRYHARPKDELRRFLKGAGIAGSEVAERVSAIGRVADALDRGDTLLARRLATGLSLPIPRSAVVAAIAKAGFNDGEPRVPPGSGMVSGEWTTFAVPNYRAQVFTNHANSDNIWNRFHAAARALPGQSGTQSFAYGETFAGEGGLTPAGERVAGISQHDLDAAKKAMPDLLARAAMVNNITAEQAAAVYRYMADQNFHTVGGSAALDRVGDPYAEAALNDTMFWEGVKDGANTVQQAINEVAGKNRIPEDGAMGLATLNAYSRLAQNPDSRGELLDALAQKRTDWATRKRQNDQARINHFRYLGTRD